jgi:hypothetical protein
LVEILAVFLEEIELKEIGRVPRSLGEVGLVLVATTVSTKLFHSPQFGHFPI